jgi:hypothetical protein
MNKLKIKATTIAFTTFLIVAMAIALFPLNTVAGQETRVTHPYIGATPNPVGAGQETLLHIGIMEQLTVTQQGWEGLTVTVEHPDGHTETLDGDGDGFRTDSTGGTGYSFVPPVDGEYILRTHFPEQVTTNDKNAATTSVGTIMEESVSPPLTLVVQGEPVPVYPETPLPAEYWTRPIDNQLRGWAPVSGSQLEAASYGADIRTGNGDAPETAHVLWQQPLEGGGLAGGDLGGAGAYTGDAYEGKFPGSLIIQGILIYQKFDTVGNGEDITPDNWLVAVDVHTGETIWEKELFAYGDPTDARVYPGFGFIYYWDSFNAHGTHPYLICTTSAPGLMSSVGSTWHAFDPLTARWEWTWTNCPTGTRNRGPHGEIIVYTVSTTAGTISMWNSSAVIDAYWGTSENSPNWGSWRPQGKIIDAQGDTATTSATPLGKNGLQWQVDITGGDISGSVADYKIDDRIVGYDWVATQSGMFSGTLGVSEITIWGVDISPGNEGEVLFSETWDAPDEWVDGDVALSLSATSIEDGLMAFWAKERTHHVGFSTEDGEYMWGPTDSQNYLDFLGHHTGIAYGKYFSVGMSGIVYCYDALNGSLLWTYEADDPYNQVLWSNQWHIRPLFFADGKLYLGTSEHSPVDPLPRGSPFVAVDCETGEEVFRADGMYRQTDWGGRAVIGDSIIATMDTYDLQVYGIGKGPSATTVEAPDASQPFGTPILVKGMVTDVSPGTEEYALTARFPNGVPAVCDANMTDWMLYVYKQFARPADVIGVEVTLTVLDPNGNIYDVGTATSDASGLYSCVFTPEVPGKYTITAAFAGSGAYYASFAETAINVEEAVEATPPPTEPPASVADMYMIPSTIGIIVAVAIVGLLLVMMIRKR